MNEFVACDSVSRLVGTFERPQGLLTSAVRRHPYSVVLLDEIEKAHPAVFDLLLQVLGDGRLTDAVGQSADFCNCIVIMTSNLGARDARRQLGFASASRDDSEVYREAAKKFFRPELFNRLDKVIAFHALDESHLRGLVESLVNKALGRQGITARRINLEVSPELPAALVSLGFKPEYGARALRRAIEEHLIEPLSIQIGDLPLNEPASVRLSIDESNRLVFASNRFVEGGRVAPVVRVAGQETALEVVERCNAFLQRMDQRLEAWLQQESGDGQSGTSSSGAISPIQMHYYRMREELVFLRQQRDALAVAGESQRAAARTGKPVPLPSRFGKDLTRLVLPYDRAGGLLEAFYESPDPDAFVKELAARGGCSAGACLPGGRSHPSREPL